MKVLARWPAIVIAVCAGCGHTSADVDDAVPEARKPKATPPAHVVGGFSIELPSFQLAAGEEAFPCWVLPLEIDGPSRIVGGGRLTTTAGLHHGNVTSRPKSGQGVRACETANDAQIGGSTSDILAGGAVLFASSTQIVGDEWQSFPDGMGYPVADGYEIVARMHYVNATAEDVSVAPTYSWYTIDEEQVTNVLGPFAWILQGWEIPPLAEHTATAICEVPGDMHIVNALPHMHALGTEFFAEHWGGPRDGQRWLDSVGYDPDDGVLLQYHPAVALAQGTGARFGCTWKNTFNKPIYEGFGDNEMCILFGYAYPYGAAYSGIATAEGGCLMLLPPPPGSGD